MSTTATAADQATRDAGQAIEAAGIEGLLHADGMDDFSVTSEPVSMPRSFGDAIMTTVRACGPLAGADMPAVAATLRDLPGILQVSAGPGWVAAYRSAAR